MKEQKASDHDRRRLDQRIADAEKRTQAQIIVAVIKRSDTYAEVPWKAFAFGASTAGLLVVALGLLPCCRTPGLTFPLAGVTAVLGVGAVFALLAVLVPGFARLFLSSPRAEVEVRQYAQSLFLERELFATAGRTGVLLLVSLFERQVILLPDKGLRKRLTDETTRDVIGAITSCLARNEVNRALEQGIDRLALALEATLSAAEVKSGKNELADEIIEEKGV